MGFFSKLFGRDKSRLAQSRERVQHNLNAAMRQLGVDVEVNGQMALNSEGAYGDGVAVNLVDGKPIVTVASVIPSVMDSAQDYLKQVKELQEDQDHGTVVDVCNRLYENEGVVSSAVDKIVDLSITAGSVENCKNDELKQILDYWVGNLNNIMTEEDLKQIESNPLESGKVYGNTGLLGLMEDVAVSYFVTGDAVLVENWRKDVPVPILDKKYILPRSIVLYDIKSIEVDAAANSLGVDKLSLRISSELTELVNSTDTNTKKLVESTVGEFLIKQVKSGAGTVVLPPILTTRFKRRGVNRRYGIPLIKSAFRSIASKLRLQALDDATIAGIVKRLLILKVGHEDVNSPLHIPTPERVAILRNALRNPELQKMLVWAGDDLSVLDIQANADILGRDKYAPADDEISMSLGVPRVLIDGNATVGANDWKVVVSTIATLEKFRAKLKQRIDRWFRMIAVKNGFEDESPVWRWSIMTLRDERAARLLIIKAWESNLISREDVLKLLGLPAKEMIDKLVEERQSGVEDQIGVPNISFSKQPGRPDGEDDSPDSDRQVGTLAAMTDDVRADFTHERLLAVYRTIEEAVAQADNDIKWALDVGFANYSSFVNDYIRALFAVNATEKMADYGQWELRLSMWIQQFVLKFRDQAIGLFNTADFPQDAESQKSEVIEYLRSQEYRVKMTDDAIYAKVLLANKLMNFQDRGVFQAKVVLNETDCEACKKTSGRVYNIDDIFDVLPVHPGCTCDVAEA